jgi:flagellar biosynthesis protein FliP
MKRHAFSGSLLCRAAFAATMTSIYAPLAAASASQQNVLQLPGMTVRAESTPITIIVLLTVLTLLPAILLSMTPFVRILIIFHFLRQALGTQTAPTNQTLIGLSLFLTYFLMQPVMADVQKEAIRPFEQKRITIWQALDRSATPMRHFMLNYTREKDLALFLEMSREPRPGKPDDLPMRVVIPAYVLSELKTGFQIGAVLFLPFLVIDLVNPRMLETKLCGFFAEANRGTQLPKEES